MNHFIMACIKSVRAYKRTKHEKANYVVINMETKSLPFGFIIYFVPS